MAIGKYFPELRFFCDYIASLAILATVTEASVTKPGNASRYRDIKSVSFDDLVASAILTAPFYSRACEWGYYGEGKVYQGLLEAVREVKALSRNYAIFGTALLLFPLLYESANARSSRELTARATQLVMTLGSDEAEFVKLSLSELGLSYLGRLDSNFDFREFRGSLYDMMRFSSDVDEVARELVSGYRLSLKAYGTIKKEGVVRAFLKVLCEQPDTLILRKSGSKAALTVSQKACDAYNGVIGFEEFDSYLVQNGLNPGSTADIIATALFLKSYDDWWALHPDYSGYLRKGCGRVTRKSD